MGDVTGVTLTADSHQFARTGNDGVCIVDAEMSPSVKRCLDGEFPECITRARCLLMTFVVVISHTLSLKILMGII